MKGEGLLTRMPAPEILLLPSRANKRTLEPRVVGAWRSVAGRKAAA